MRPEHGEARRKANFMEKVSVDPVSGCWFWNGSMGGTGYGHFRVHDRMMNAHRASWLMHRGPIPAGIFVLHRCDIRQCVYPSHLFLGTHDENMRDMTSKNRACSGENHRFCTILDATVLEIRRRGGAGETGASIARSLGISKAQANKIINGTARPERP